MGLERWTLHTDLDPGAEVEGDLDGSRPLVAGQLRGGQRVGDGAGGGHVAAPLPVHPLALGALDVGAGGAAQESLEAGAVVGVAAARQAEGGGVLLHEADGALLLRVAAGPGHRVGGDEVPAPASCSWSRSSRGRCVSAGPGAASTTELSFDISNFKLKCSR